MVQEWIQFPLWWKSSCQQQWQMNKSTRNTKLLTMSTDVVFAQMLLDWKCFSSTKNEQCVLFSKQLCSDCWNTFMLNQHAWQHMSDFLCPFWLTFHAENIRHTCVSVVPFILSCFPDSIARKGSWASRHCLWCLLCHWHLSSCDLPAVSWNRCMFVDPNAHMHVLTRKGRWTHFAFDNSDWVAVIKRTQSTAPAHGLRIRYFLGADTLTFYTDRWQI